MPRPKGSADLLEDRRRRALALLRAGYSLHETGRRIGCNASSVMRWRDAWRRGGAKAFAGAFLSRPSLEVERGATKTLGAAPPSRTARAGLPENQTLETKELDSMFLGTRKIGFTITIDDLWSENLATVAELREGIHWVSWGGRDPLHEYLMAIDKLYRQLQAGITDEIPKRLAQAETSSIDPYQRGATWTYLTTDQPFGTFNERVIRGLVRKVKTRSFWG